jgi:hypothetical protein
VFRFTTWSFRARQWGCRGSYRAGCRSVSSVSGFSGLCRLRTPDMTLSSNQAFSLPHSASSIVPSRRVAESRWPLNTGRRRGPCRSSSPLFAVASSGQPPSIGRIRGPAIPAFRLATPSNSSIRRHGSCGLKFVDLALSWATSRCIVVNRRGGPAGLLRIVLLNWPRLLHCPPSGGAHLVPAILLATKPVARITQTNHSQRGDGADPVRNRHPGRIARSVLRSSAPIRRRPGRRRAARIHQYLYDPAPTPGEVSRRVWRFHHAFFAFHTKSPIHNPDKG